MNPLSIVLIFKIIFTVAALCIPLLLFRMCLFNSLRIKVPEPILYFRLLGMAYTALVVGYLFGLQTSLHGGYPASTVWMGIVSNGGAFLYLVLNAKSGTWATWGKPAGWIMRCALAFTGFITVGLIIAGPITYGVSYGVRPN